MPWNFSLKEAFSIKDLVEVHAGCGHVSIVLLITFESSIVVVSRARLYLLIYFFFMSLRV